MTTTVSALSVPDAGKPFETVDLERRDLKPNDVRIKIKYAGICHSDIHQARDEWGAGIFPMTPGHEIIGSVEEVGSDVTTHAVGDTVGVGCFVDSCLECDACKDGEEQFCDQGVVQTYSAKTYDGEVTYGGYSEQVVVRDHFAVKVPDGVDLAGTTPLLCAGITTYAPLVRHGVTEGSRVGVIGMGGLGHVAVKIAAALGAKVTVLSRTDAKKEDGLAFGASEYVATEEEGALKNLQGCICPGDKALCCSFLITRRAVDLASKKQTLNTLCLQRVMQIARIKKIIFDRITRACDMTLL